MHSNNENISNINMLNKIRNKYLLKTIFDNLLELKQFQLIKYNKKIQNKIEISLQDFQLFKKIIIEIIPIKKNDKNKFINIPKEKKNYYHIYFNKDKKEMKRNYFTQKSKVESIKIVIDEKITSLFELFKRCDCIEKINFIRFNRSNIKNMNYMFYECSSLKELNLKNFNTDNAINMNYMFYKCSKLKELNLNSFNFNNVIYMKSMFTGCSDEIKNKIRFQFPNLEDETFL